MIYTATRITVTKPSNADARFEVRGQWDGHHVAYFGEINSVGTFLNVNPEAKERTPQKMTRPDVARAVVGALGEEIRREYNFLVSRLPTYPCSMEIAVGCKKRIKIEIKVTETITAEEVK